MENIDGYLAVSQSCSEILSTIRYYPYPAIVYKIAFNKLLTGQQPQSIQPEKTQSQPTNTIKKNNKPNNPEPAEKSDTQKPEEKGQNPITTNDEQTQQEDTTQEEPTHNTQSDNNTNNFDNVKSQLLGKIDKQSLKDNLADNIYIQSFENNTVHMITISSMANMLLQKQDTIQYLEKLLAEIYEKPVALKVKFIKKEDFLQSMI